MISRSQSGIAVGTGNQNSSALTSEDLTRYMTIHTVVGATLTEGSPIIGVRDMDHYYSGDTKAGFKVGAPGSVLGVSAAEVEKFKIRYYKDGETVGESGLHAKGFNLLKIELGNIPDTTATYDIVASEAPGKEYNEIALLSTTGLLDADVVSGLKLFYAFVGDGDILLTTDGIKRYNPSYKVSIARTNGVLDAKDLIGDTKEHCTVWGISPTIRIEDTENPDQEAFPAGAEVSFLATIVKAVGIGVTPNFRFYDRNGNEVQNENVGSTVLSVDLGARQEIYSIRAEHPFSQVRFTVHGLIQSAVAFYGYVTLPTQASPHHCNMSPVASLDICDCDNVYTLDWDRENFPDAYWKALEYDNNSFILSANYTDPGVPVIWKVDFFKAPYTLRLRLVNTDDCADTITINYGSSFADKYKPKENFLVNRNADDPEYMLSDGTTANLLQLASITKNTRALLTPSLTDYAVHAGGVELAGQTYICGIKKVPGKGEISSAEKDMKAGFVVTMGNTALDAEVLKFYNVRLYYKGEQVQNTPIVPAISASLIGSADTRKVRYMVNVPRTVKFDEMRLYSEGLLNADLSGLKVYYAFTADADAVLDDITEGAELVSYHTTGATINADATNNAGVAVIGQGLEGLPNCIDDDLYGSAAMFPAGVNVATGAMIDVKIGRTVTRNHQFIIAVDKEALGLGAGVIDILQVKTFRQGREVENLNSDDWGVLGLNVITIGDRGYIVVNHELPFDEIQIINGNGVNLLQNLKIYGFLLRNDANGDGVPDIEDLQPCLQDLVLDEDQTFDRNKENYTNVRLYLRRSFTPGQWTSICLPVDLTYAQFVEAFGKEALLDEFRGLTEDGVTLDFRILSEPDDVNAVFLHKNVPYAICVASEQVRNSADSKYATIDAGEISGEIYNVLDGVSFAKREAVADRIDGTVNRPDGMQLADGDPTVSFIGYYNPTQTIPAGKYVFSAGKVVKLDKDMTDKSFRAWIESSNPIITGVDGVDADAKADYRIFDTQGRFVGFNRDRLAPGVYICNGKRFIIH